MTDIKAEQQSTESRILQAAEEEFMAKGFEGARTMAIAKRAGVTHAMLHYYFRTKQMLFERIIAEKTKQIGGIMSSVFVAGDMPLMERVRLGVERHFDFVAANPDLPRFIAQEVYSHPERHAIMQTQLASMAAELLKDMQKNIDDSADAGLTTRIDARMLILDIVSLNIFTFICYPLVQPLLGNLGTDREAFLAQRKAENVEVIMRRIKKL